MARIALCTALYEAGRPFLGDWLAGVLAATEEAAGRHDVQVVIAVHGLEEPEAAVAPLRARVPVRLAEAPESASLAAVRALMLRAAGETDAEVLVFVDMDDMLLPGALDSHLEALDGADFSYGDLIPIDAGGGGIGLSFFAGARVPGEVSDHRAVLTRNFLGFSNSALRRARLAEAACAVPSSVRAADWWVFTTLLAQGRCGKRTAVPVARYRSHPGNILGARPDPAPEAVLRRCDIVRRHYAALTPAPRVAAQDKAVAELARRVAADPAGMAEALRAACARPGVWYEDIARLAAPYLARTVTVEGLAVSS